MAYRLLCEAADVFVAAAGQAGTLGVDSCQPSQPVSLRHIHGTADTNLPLDGGRGSSSIAGIDFPSPRGRDPQRSRLRTAAPAGRRPSRTARSRPAAWRSCDGGTVVELVTVDGASHAWMGSTGRDVARRPRAEHGVRLESPSWDFLTAHPRPG